jgi:hypothetical protein
VTDGTVRDRPPKRYCKRLRQHDHGLDAVAHHRGEGAVQITLACESEWRA